MRRRREAPGRSRRAGSLGLVAAGAILLAAITVFAAPAAALQQEPGQRRTRVQRDPRLQEARSLVSQGRLQRARELLREILEVEPRHSEAHLLAGRAALGTGDLEAAERHLTAARDHSPRFPFMVHHALGMLRLTERDLEGARREFGLALEAAPGFAPSRLARARAALLQGDVATGREELEAVASGEGSPRTAEAIVLLGELDLLAGRGSEAVARFRSVAGDPQDPESTEGPRAARMVLSTLAGSPAESEPRVRAWLGEHLNDTHAWFWLGLVEAAGGDRESAARRFSVALAIDDQHAPSWLAARNVAPPGEEPELPAAYPQLSWEMGRARRALGDGDPELAATIAGEILEARPLFVPARLLRVQAAEARGDLLGALVRLEEVLEAAPDLTRLLVHRATLARAVGALELAERSARSALEQRPEEGSLHYLLGTILADAGRSGEAIDSLERAVELGHRTADLYVTLGNLRHERQEIAAAVDAMQQAVELDPAAAGRIAGFALTAMTAELTATVREILEGHLERRPDDVDTLYTLGSLYLRQGELDAAEEAFTRLRELAPDRARIHYNLALIHRRRGDREAAQREMERFRGLKEAEDRDWKAHNRAYRLRQRADDALAAGELDRAVELLRELLAGDLAEPRDRVTLGRALLRRGDPEAALQEVRTAMERLPHDPVALCAGAAAAAAAGRPAESVEELERRAALLMGHPCPPDEAGTDPLRPPARPETSRPDGEGDGTTPDLP